MKLTLNIYDKTGKEIIRTAAGEMHDITFGTIERIMELLNIENAKNDMEVIARVYGAYAEVKDVLALIFTDVTETEWRTVKVKELLPILFSVVRFTFAQMKELPGNSKN